MEPGFLAALPWGALTERGLLFLVVIMLLYGWLVPKFVYLEATKERDTLREQLRRSERVRTEALKQVAVLAKAVDKMANKENLGASLIESVKAENGADQ